MDKKIIIGAVIVILAILGIAAFTMNGSNSTERAADELVMAVDIHSGEPEGGFDPLTGWGSGHQVEPLIQSRLFKVNENSTIENDAATDYQMASDAKSFDVTLRDDIKFTDDTPLTSEDVVFSYKTAMENGVIDLSTLENVTAVDDTHVKFTLNKPDSTFIYKLTQLGIVPSDSYNNATYGEHPVGSGPYKLVQWDKGQQAIFELNENYYGEKPQFKKLTNLFMDGDAAFAAAKKGEVDLVELPLSYYNETIEGMRMVHYPSIDVRAITLPVVADEGQTNEAGGPIGNPVTSDPAIREALSVGINRQAIIDGAQYGLGEVSYDGVSSQLPYSTGTNVTDGNIDQAKQILADAGWKDTDGDGIVEKDGQKATWELDYPSDDSTRQAVALQFAEQAKQIGIEITPEGKTWDEMESTINSNSVVLAFGSNDPYVIYGELDSEVAHTAFSNPSSINNSEVDSYISQAMSQNVESSYSTWANAIRAGQKENGYVWIGSVDYLFFVSDSLDISDDTHTIYPHGGDVWGNIADWKRIDTNSTS